MWSSKDAGCVHVLAEIANFGCEWFFKVLFMGELTGCKRFGCVCCSTWLFFCLLT
jgi:hypothetical protein